MRRELKLAGDHIGRLPGARLKPFSPVSAVLVAKGSTSNPDCWQRSAWKALGLGDACVIAIGNQHKLRRGSLEAG